MTLLLPGLAGAGPPDARSADAEPARVLGFARGLVLERDYYRAISEYKRFIHYFPQDPAVPRARMGMAEAYRAGNKLSLAASGYLDVVAHHPGSIEAQQAAFEAAQCYYASLEYSVAESHYQTLLEDYPEHPQACLAHYRMAFSRIGRHDFAGAMELLGSTPPDSQYSEAAQELVHRLDESQRPVQRSPLLAGVLSGLLPGSGQLYAGRVGDGLLALLVNAIFALGTYEAVVHETYTAAALLGSFGLGFYLGNIFGAVNAAHRQSRLDLQRYVSDLVLELEQPRLPAGQPKEEAPGSDAPPRAAPRPDRP